MKNVILFILTLLLTQLTFSQTVTIHKNDQTTVDFQLSQIDSITFSTSAQGIKLETSSWKCFNTVPSLNYIAPATGTFEKADNGLKIYGDGYQGTQAIYPVSFSQHPIMDKTIYLKWKANGDGSFLSIAAALYSDTISWSSVGKLMNLTTSYSSDGSVVINDDVWYYTRIVISSNLITTITAAGNYDNNNGTVIQRQSLVPDKQVTVFSFGIYAGTTSYTTLCEARIE